MDGEYLDRLYLGANIGGGKYFRQLGYLFANLIAGGFYRNGALSQGIFEMSTFYYSPLIYQNRYSSRLFINVNYRQAITRDINATFDFGENIRHLDQEDIAGKSTLSINIESVLFTPWYFYGFRFAPFLFADLGLISKTRYVFFNYDFYSAPGIGFRIRNESLAFKNFVVSFGILPQAPPGEKNIFYNFAAGDHTLVQLMPVQKPYILRRDLVFPY